MTYMYTCYIYIKHTYNYIILGLYVIIKTISDNVSHKHVSKAKTKFKKKHKS